jgi:hypothetical protein
MTWVRALRTLHVPSPTYSPEIEMITGLAIPVGDRSIKVVLRSELVELPEAEAAAS